jgi:hypothetical protein
MSDRRLIGPPRAHQDAPCTDACYEAVPAEKATCNGLMFEGHPGQLTDGYHTMEELYDHRRALTAALAAERADISWRSKAHHPDGDPMFEGGYFIVGIDTPAGTITYHYKLSHWDDFAAVPELEHAPKWDGATPGDTVIRLLTWAADSGPDLTAPEVPGEQ